MSAGSYSVKAVLGAVDKNFTSSFQKARESISGINKAVSGIGFGIMTGAGMAAFNTVASAAKGFVGDIYNVGSSFETATSQISATMQQPKEEIQDIIDKARELGASTKYTATEAAEGFNILAQSGLKAHEQIATMPSVLNLAAAGAMELDSAAGYLTGSVKGFGDEFNNASHYADLMAKGASLANTDVSALGEALSQGAATAHTYGQSAESTTLALLRLAEQNVTGATAATAMKRAMADIYTPTKEAAAAMKSLGVEAYDPVTHKAKDFNQVVDELNSAMSGMTEKQRNATAATIFTQRGLEAFNKMTVSSADKVDEFSEALANCGGAAEDMYKKQTDNLQGDVDIWHSSVDAIKETIYSDYVGGLRAIVKGASGVATAINQSLKDGAIRRFVTNAGKYFNVFKINVQKVGLAFGRAFSAVGKALSKINGDFGSLKNVKSFADVCHVVSDALVALAGFIEQHADTIAKIISILPKVVAGFMAFKAVSFVAGIITTIGGAIGGLATGIAGLVGNKLATTATDIEGVGTASSTSTGPMLAAAKSFMMIGAGVALVALGFGILAQSAIALASAGTPAIAVMAGLVIGVAALSLGMMALATHAAATAAQMSAAGTAFLMIGAAVLLVAVGFGIMAASAIALTNAGTPAIAMFFGMVAIMALLAVGAAALAPALTAGSVGLIAFGAAVLMVGAGLLLAGAGIALVSGTLPTLVAYGTEAATAFLAVGTALIFFGAGAFVGGAGALVLAAGLIAAGAGAIVAAAGMVAVAVGVAALGVAALIAAAGTLALGMALTLVGSNAVMVTAGCTALSAGTLMLSASVLTLTAAFVAFTAAILAVSAANIAGVASFAGLAAAVTASAAGMALLATATAAVAVSVSSINSDASSAASALSGMEKSVSVVSSGVTALGNTVSSVMSSVERSVKGGSTNAAQAISNGGQKATQAVTQSCQSIVRTMQSAATQAGAAGTQMGQRFTNGIRSGGVAAVSAAQNISNNAANAMRSGYGTAYAAGSYIGQGLAQGLASQAGAVASQAAALANAANAAIAAKAKIGSPSKVTDQYGQWYGQGWINGIAKKVKEAARKVRELVAVPSDLHDIHAGDFVGRTELDEEYSYSREQVIITKTYLDGREIARSEAPYRRSLDAREARKTGRTVMRRAAFA